MTLEPPPIPEGFLTRWCETLAESSESPPGAFLPTGLALLSAIVGPRLVMRWGVAHEERMNLWILNVGMSALARKTSGMSGLRAAVGWVADDDDLIRTINFARLSDAGLVSSLDVVSGDTIKAAKDAADFPQGPKNKEAEAEVKYVYRDVPMAWVATFNEVSPIWTDEGAGWAMDAQRVLLAIYDGQLGSTTKATKVPSQECFVTAIGNIPPGVLRDQTTLGMLSSGFVGRWLVIPTPAPREIVSFPMPNGADPLNRLRDEIEGLLHVAKQETRVVVNELWTEDAKAMRHEWYAGHRALYEDMSPDDPIAVAGAELFGRLQATAVKVATLIAVGRSISRLKVLGSLRVTCDDVDWASRTIDASIAYMTTLLQEGGASDVTTTSGQAEGRILRYLSRVDAYSDETAVTLTEVADACKGKRVSRADITKAIDGLLQSGHVDVLEAGNIRRVRVA